jgi:hypothetical protein
VAHIRRTVVVAFDAVRTEPVPERVDDEHRPRDHAEPSSNFHTSLKALHLHPRKEVEECSMLVLFPVQLLHCFDGVECLFGLATCSGVDPLVLFRFELKSFHVNEAREAY